MNGFWPLGLSAAVEGSLLLGVSSSGGRALVRNERILAVGIVGRLEGSLLGSASVHPAAAVGMSSPKVAKAFSPFGTVSRRREQPSAQV